nr:AbrB family transcriptional regulator [Pelagibacterium limicola]
MPDIFRLLAVFCVAIAAGWGFERLGVPLPWMIGPLVSTAAIFALGLVKRQVPNKIRIVGQVVVASQVGLTFTPAALAMLLEWAPVIVTTSLMTGLCIVAVSALLSKASGMRLSQAFLAGAPTSPVEAASMAIKAGIDPTAVTYAQTLRLSAVVIILPFALFSLSGWPDAGRTPVHWGAFDVFGATLLGAIGLGGALIARMLRIPNPNFLGPLAFAAALAAAGYGPMPFPGLILALAQVVLGTWLGSNFQRRRLASAGRLTLHFAASTMLVLGMCSGCAVVIAFATGLNWETLVLGAAPGGVVEMALTAKFLGQNVSLITAFHLTRIFMFMPAIPWIVHFMVRHERRNTPEAVS